MWRPLMAFPQSNGSFLGEIPMTAAGAVPVLHTVCFACPVFSAPVGLAIPAPGCGQVPQCQECQKPRRGTPLWHPWHYGTWAYRSRQGPPAGPDRAPSRHVCAGSQQGTPVALAAGVVKGANVGGYLAMVNMPLPALRNRLASPLAAISRDTAACTAVTMLPNLAAWPGNWAVFSSAKMIRTDFGAARHAWQEARSQSRDGQRPHAGETGRRSGPEPRSPSEGQGE